MPSAQDLREVAALGRAAALHEAQARAEQEQEQEQEQPASPPRPDRRTSRPRLPLSPLLAASRTKHGSAPARPTADDAAADEASPSHEDEEHDAAIGPSAAPAEAAAAPDVAVVAATASPEPRVPPREVPSLGQPLVEAIRLLSFAVAVAGGGSNANCLLE